MWARQDETLDRDRGRREPQVDAGGHFGGVLSWTPPLPWVTRLQGDLASNDAILAVTGTVTAVTGGSGGRVRREVPEGCRSACGHPAVARAVSHLTWGWRGLARFRDRPSGRRMAHVMHALSSAAAPSASGWVPSASGRAPIALRRLPSALRRLPIALRRPPSASGRLPTALRRLPSALRWLPSASGWVPGDLGAAGLQDGSSPGRPGSAAPARRCNSIGERPTGLTGT